MQPSHYLNQYWQSYGIYLRKCHRKWWSYFWRLISYPLRPGDIYASVVIKAIIGSDNGLLPDWHQATTWINDILSIRPWGTHFNDILFEIQKFSFKKMHFKTSSAKWHTFCLSLNVLMAYSTAELNDKKWVQFICILLTCFVTFLSVYTTQWDVN